VNCIRLRSSISSSNLSLKAFLAKAGIFNQTFESR
jgi:hypothetical protein